MEEKLSFSVKMTVKEIYRFTMYHVYFQPTGFLEYAISVIAAIILAWKFQVLTTQTKIMLILLSCWFILIDPVILYFRARGQLKRNKAYQNDLKYDIDKNGITVSQGELSQTIGWMHLIKIVETKSQFLIYSNRVNAFIFPKSAIGEDCEKFENMILEFTKGNQIQLKGAIKKKKN